jgi:AcrR family transcriptional regulator
MAQRLPTELRRRQIAEATIQIIGERGLREFTAAQIADRVGIKDGTIFRHFKNKQEILLAAVELLEEIMARTIPEPHEDPLERLGQFFLKRVQVVCDNPGIQSLVFTDQLAHALDEQGQSRLVALRNQGRRFIQERLEEAAAAGTVRDDLDLVSLVALVNGAVMSLLFLKGDGAMPVSIERQATRLWETFQSLIRR